MEGVYNILLQAIGTEFGVEAHTSNSKSFQAAFHRERRKARERGIKEFDSLRLRIIDAHTVFIIKDKEQQHGQTDGEVEPSTL